MKKIGKFFKLHGGRKTHFDDKIENSDLTFEKKSQKIREILFTF